MRPVNKQNCCAKRYFCGPSKCLATSPASAIKCALEQRVWSTMRSKALVKKFCPTSSMGANTVLLKVEPRGQLLDCVSCQIHCAMLTMTDDNVIANSQIVYIASFPLHFIQFSRLPGFFPNLCTLDKAFSSPIDCHYRANYYNSCFAGAARVASAAPHQPAAESVSRGPICLDYFETP